MAAVSDTATIVARLALVVAVVTSLIDSSYFSVTAGELAECKKLCSASRIREENAIKPIANRLFRGGRVRGWLRFSLLFPFRLFGHHYIARLLNCLVHYNVVQVRPLSAFKYSP
jgi:hypothetical protein